MRPYETMAAQTKFVKKTKLVIFIGKETENLISFKKLINKFKFNGTVKYYRSTQEAIDFLQTVRKPNNKRATADLIFCHYKMPETNGLELIENLQFFYQCEAENGLQGQQLKPRVIICSNFTLETFQTYVVKRGALGFLPIPLQLTDFQQCCLKFGLFGEDSLPNY